MITVTSKSGHILKYPKKKNCPAAIHIQQIAKFPNFKVGVLVLWG